MRFLTEERNLVPDFTVFSFCWSHSPQQIGSIRTSSNRTACLGCRYSQEYADALEKYPE